MTLFRVFYSRQGKPRSQSFTHSSPVVNPAVEAVAHEFVMRARGAFLYVHKVEKEWNMKDAIVVERDDRIWLLILVALLSGCVMFMVGQWTAERQLYEEANSIQRNLETIRNDVEKARNSLRAGCYDFIRKNRGAM